ncbi:MAG: nucleotidyltransferase family protein [Thermoguttaceae bacterium]|nr:nucleotidyltransferase family protein [Thermoguttaceae bacterium]MDW8039184.1 nucleotidyltransferase family protein [Thermoguttaceae bacterium]
MLREAIDKVVILARGLGTRMRRQDTEVVLAPEQEAVAQQGLKALVPVGRPFLDYVLTALADAGYRRICLVVAPDHTAIRDYYTRQAPPRRIEISYAVQPEPRGTADAVAAAESFVQQDSFLMINSDNYYPLEALSRLRQGSGSAVALFEQETMIRLGNIPAERVRQFAVAQMNGAGCLTRILEKPTEATLAALPRPLWISMNCWRFRPTIFEACRRIGPSPRGEYEITDAVQYAIDHLGERFQAILVQAAVLDLTCRKDILPVQQRLASLAVDY